MNKNIVLQLCDKIQAYDEPPRKFLFAMISCPWRLERGNLSALAKAQKIPLKIADDFLSRFERDGLFMEPPVLLADLDWRRPSKVTWHPAGFAAALAEMGPNDVTTRKYQRAYQTGKPRWFEPAYTATQYSVLIERAVAADPRRVGGSTLKKSIPGELASLFDDIWRFMLVDKRWKTFLSMLPFENATGIGREFAAFVSSGPAWMDVEVMASQFPGMDVPDGMKGEVNDWYRFMRFLHEGEPARQLAHMQPDSMYSHLLKGITALSADNVTEAYREAKKALENNSKSVRSFQGFWENFFYGLILYRAREVPLARQSMQALRDFESHTDRYREILTLFSVMGLGEDPDRALAGFMKRHEGMRPETSRALLAVAAFGLHADTLFGSEPTDTVAADIDAVSADFPVVGLMWSAVTGDTATAERLGTQLGIASPFKPERRVERWERVLDGMIAATAGITADGAAGPAVRIVYYLDTHDWELQPRLQKTKNGTTWTKGRDIRMDRFAKGDVEGMTPQDKAIAAAGYWESDWYRNETFKLDGADMLKAIVGHPHIYDRDEPHQHLEIRSGELQLSVTRRDGRFVVTSAADDAEVLSGNKGDCFVRRPQEGVIEVTDYPKEDRKLIANLKEAGPLPEAAQNKLTTVLERLSAKMTVMSDLLKNSEVLEKKKASPKIVLQLAPNETEGYTARAVVRPLAEAGVVCEPGKGLEYLALRVNGQPVQAVRSLKKEKANLAALTEKLAFLDGSRADDTHWSLTAEECLEFLNAVRDLKDTVVEWPEGAKFKVIHATVGFEALSLSVRKMKTWFEVTGEVKLDGKTKLKMAEVLRLVREAKGNFIALGDNEYVALTDSLKKQLAALDRLTSGTKNPQLSVFNSGLISELEKNGAQIEADKEFRSLTERIKKAADVTALVPAGLTTELRDYQEEGFLWMTKLASWGAGAVLADDMGLGKTVQTIAVLLSRAELGPQLVIVPASVLLNWRDELTKCAPGLKQVILNLAEDREAVLKQAEKGTVVITTYGILTAEIKELAQKTWATAVFDEAHNIKNKETKAFKAATEVKADFRVMLTGTPLQNHLAEIWALFEIAVPGLLGSFTRFTDRFVLPIECDKDREQQRLLKRIVSPFILRRTKTDVLSELPEKTEMTVKVELSPEEKALYEQLREETQESLASGEINSMQALASLMKLRQAACSAELVDPKLTLPSSKTQAFLTLAEELIENRHRALVFSQFTSHLALIRRALDEKGIKYLYLDGSMTPAQRMKLVETFENGDMPLFLISLKAGGTGLNLTAADYVIHMDPWWNPAIEDQASDRAYRIGQERPVTIYRLIAAGTVEEKILKLHATKKSLADALLEGTEMSSRLGREEIMELLSLAQ